MMTRENKNFSGVESLQLQLVMSHTYVYAFHMKDSVQLLASYLHLVLAIFQFFIFLAKTFKFIFLPHIRVYIRLWQ